MENLYRPVSGAAAALAGWFAPIVPLVACVFGFIAVDFLTGVAASRAVARREGRPWWFESAEAWRTVQKLALVATGIVMAWAVDRHVLDFMDLHAARLFTGFACGVAAAAAFLGQILSQVLAVTDDFAPWLTVLTGAFVAVLLIFLGRTSWSELVAPRESAVAEGVAPAVHPAAGDARTASGDRAAYEDAPAIAGASDECVLPARADAPGDAFQLAEPSMQNTLEARCAKVTEARGLSPREAEVLVYLARGFTPACIAKSLVLSISTVRTHVRNIYRKLGINKREELLHLIDEE